MAGFPAGRFAQKKEWANMAVALLVILIFAFQEVDLTGLICVAVPAFALGLFAKKVEWTMFFFTLASGAISYYSDSALSALVFAGGAGVLVRMLWKNKKKGVAITLAAITIVTTIVLLP
ncbi:hypothetical protein ACQEU6_27380 [Spirillospora sp. CA-108201]